MCKNKMLKKIAVLESRVTDLEQYTRMNDLVIGELETRPTSYAKAAGSVNGEPTEADLDSIEQHLLP